MTAASGWPAARRSQRPIPPPSSILTATTWPSPTRSASAAAVEVEVDELPGLDRRARAAEGEVLGGDQAAERGDAEVRQVDPAEQPVPVAVVRLAGVEVVDGPRRGRLPRGIASTRSLTRSICLWRSLTSRYLTWKLRQIAPRSQRASGRPLGRGLVDGAGEGERPRRPAAPTRPSRRTSPSAGRRARPGPWPSSQADGVIVAQPVAVRLEGGEEFARPSRSVPSNARTSSASRRTSRRRRPSCRPARRLRWRGRGGSR